MERFRFLTPGDVKLIDRLLSDGWSVGRIARRLKVTVYLVQVIAGDDERHQPKPACRPTTPKPEHDHKRPDPGGIVLDRWETLHLPPIRCQVCGERIMVTPCRICAAKARARLLGRESD